MRRLRRSIGIGAALSFLLLGAPTDGAGADTPVHDPQAPQAEQAAARRAAAEPTGRAASVAAMRSGRLQCGDKITRSTTLTADVGPCAGTAGIIIGADNIMLNLNGHTVLGVPGPGSGNDGGIRLPNRTGVRITGLPGGSGKKGTVTGFDAGVVINGGSGNTVENLIVRDNIGFEATEAWWEPPTAELGDGIVLFKSASNRIVNNLVTNNGRYDGIGIFGLGSNANVVQGNTVQDTRGIFGNPSASGAGILVNHFFDQSPGTGLVISGNQVLSNTVRASEGSGLSNVGSVDGDIIGNVVEDNGLAFAPFATQLYVLTDYSAHGIGVQSGVGQSGGPGTNMLVKENIVNHNGLNGIYIASNANRLERNRVFNNGAIGVYVHGTDNSIIVNNSALNYILDLYDVLGTYAGEDGIDRCPNIWFGNTWGPVQPGAHEASWLGSFDTAYAPICTAAGGSGPNPPAEG